MTYKAKSPILWLQKRDFSSPLLTALLASAVSTVIPANYIKTVAGALFITLGLWMIFTAGGK